MRTKFCSVHSSPNNNIFFTVITADIIFTKLLFLFHIIYVYRDSIIKNKYMKEFTLKRFLRRQKIILHGYEERNFRYVPKIVHCLCERILKLCGCWVNDVLPSNIPLTIDFICMKLHERCMQRHESTYSLSSSNSDNSKLRSILIIKSFQIEHYYVQISNR